MRKRISGSAALLLCAVSLSLPVASAAQTSHCATYDLPERYVTQRFVQPMSYRVETVSGMRVLIAEGEIVAGEAGRLQGALARAGDVDEVWFHSPGGNAYEGPKMGRFLRQNGIAVRLRSYHACISACSYAFLGGAIRTVEQGGMYGVHMFSGAGYGPRIEQEIGKITHYIKRRDELIRSGENAEAVNQAVLDLVGDMFRVWEQESAQLAAIRARYLIEMSLSLDFMTDAFGTKSKDVCYLSQAGLRHYNVSNTS